MGMIVFGTVVVMCTHYKYMRSSNGEVAMEKKTYVSERKIEELLSPEVLKEGSYYGGGTIIQAEDRSKKVGWQLLAGAATSYMLFDSGLPKKKGEMLGANIALFPKGGLSSKVVADAKGVKNIDCNVRWNSGSNPYHKFTVEVKGATYEIVADADAGNAMKFWGPIFTGMFLTLFWSIPLAAFLSYTGTITRIK